MTAVQFGAGNIGRGFLAQLFNESGLEVVFVDVAEQIVEEINRRKSYTIQIVGPEPSAVWVSNIRAINGRDIDAVVSEIVSAEIVCTAVGANALPHISPVLSAGLLARYKNGGAPLNILLCENLHDASSRLRDLISEHLPVEHRSEVLAQTGFVQAVVSRMVPVQTEEERGDDPLSIRVEKYKRLPIDANAIVGTMPQIVGVEQISNFEAYIERKLYTHNCAHAVLGYLGSLAGHKYGYEALKDARIGSLVRAVLDETGQALILKHGFSKAEHSSHIDDLLFRFQNEALGDTCLRLAKDPLRKLSPDDRLVGAARLCESQNIVPHALSWAIAAALRHVDASDPSTCELQRRLQEQGREIVLRQVCGIAPTEKLAILIETALQTAWQGYLQSYKEDTKTENEIDARNRRGREILEKLTGAPEAMTETHTNLAPEYADWVREFALGQVWSRPGLDLKTRSLCTVAALTVLGRINSLKVHIRGAILNGATQDEIIETLLHMTIYGGFPDAWDGLAAAREVFAIMEAERMPEDGK